jgi:hypothetical protein
VFVLPRDLEEEVLTKASIRSVLMKEFNIIKPTVTQYWDLDQKCLDTSHILHADKILMKNKKYRKTSLDKMCKTCKQVLSEVPAPKNVNLANMAFAEQLARTKSTVSSYMLSTTENDRCPCRVMEQLQDKLLQFKADEECGSMMDSAKEYPSKAQLSNVLDSINALEGSLVDDTTGQGSQLRDIKNKLRTMFNVFDADHVSINLRRDACHRTLAKRLHDNWKGSVSSSAFLQICRLLDEGDGSVRSVATSLPKTLVDFLYLLTCFSSAGSRDAGAFAVKATGADADGFDDDAAPAAVAPPPDGACAGVVTTPHHK